MSPAPDAERAASSWADRRFHLALAVMCLLAAVPRVGLLVESLRGNPFALAPQNDAEVYWDAAARIAAGQWTDDQPFFSAPFYEYFVAVIRALGGGLAALYVLQLLIHLATAVLIALIGRRRFAPGVGLLACGLFLLLIDPPLFATRVLSSTTQLALVCFLWWVMLDYQQRPSLPRAMLLGALLGVNCLSWPPLLVVVLLIAPWLWLTTKAPGKLARGLSALIAPIAALAVIAPATWHNYNADGSLIPIQAGSGVTFRFGNAPSATGTFHPAEGVEPSRVGMHADAAAEFERHAGRPGNWKEIDAWFYERAWADLRRDPAAAARLWARKAYWFLTGHHYGDIYLPTLERDEGRARWLLAGPLPLPWIIGPAIVGLVLLARRPIRHAPELWLFILPWLVVTAFWYSPRFRFPAVGVIVVLAAWTLSQLWAKGGARALGRAALAALLLMLLLMRLNDAANFDSQRALGASYSLKISNALERLERYDEAEHYLSRVARSPTVSAVEAARAATSLLDLLDRAGRWNRLIDLCREGLAAEPDNPDLHARLGRALDADHQTEQALVHLRRAVALLPDSPVDRNQLGLALARAGQLDEAIAQFEAAARLAEFRGQTEIIVAARTNLASALIGRNQPTDVERAADEFAAALRLRPDMTAIRSALASVYTRIGLRRQAVDLLRDGLDLAQGEDRVILANNLAWHLATSPVADLRDGHEAVRLAEFLVAGNPNAPDLLDTLAAAYAEVGRFDDALHTLDRALAAAAILVREDRFTPAQFVDMQRRRALYESRQPFRSP